MISVVCRRMLDWIDGEFSIRCDVPHLLLTHYNNNKTIRLFLLFRLPSFKFSVRRPIADYLFHSGFHMRILSVLAFFFSFFFWHHTFVYTLRRRKSCFFFRFEHFIKICCFSVRLIWLQNHSCFIKSVVQFHYPSRTCTQKNNEISWCGRQKIDDFMSILVDLCVHLCAGLLFCFHIREMFARLLWEEKYGPSVFIVKSAHFQSWNCIEWH